MALSRKKVKSSTTSRVKTSSESMKLKLPLEIENAASIKGTKPLAEATSIIQVLVMMVVHISRKVFYTLEAAHRVGLYLIGVLFLSVIADFSGKSEFYFANRDNFFNVYFVKYSWGWTMLFVGSFILLTGHSTSCGRFSVIKCSLIRLAAATAVWYGCTSFFSLIENNSGICNDNKFLNKANCRISGHRWKGLDISGHCFILIWCNLVILEEAKAYCGWENIKDILRNEEYKRVSSDLLDRGEEMTTILSRLSAKELLHLRNTHSTYTPYVRGLFCLMSALFLIWDVMLVSTILYFHILIEKVIASCTAVLCWFLLYRCFYVQPWSPGLPGQGGPFMYVTLKSKGVHKKHNATEGAEGKRIGKMYDALPKFLGMPLHERGTKCQSSQNGSKVL